MSIRLVLFVVLIQAMYLNSWSQEYVWPTNASRYITSSFAEYRPGRFHAGIDIKTWGKEGYETYAIDDGHIMRASVSPFGYGKVLYLKLNSGQIVVYGHLQRFNADVEPVIKNEQKRKGEYRVNKLFSYHQFPVKRGDVIGYTGATGVGKPHLHFEIRDQDNHPVNPFLLGFMIEDNIAPKISGLSITPLTSSSRVNSDVRPLILRPRWISRNEYVIDENILLQGKIGFAIDCHDQADGASNLFAAYRVNFYINDELKFGAEYNKFSYDVSGLIDLDRDYRLNSRGFGLFQKLYREKENILPFYTPDTENIGILDCSITEQELSTDGALRHRGPHNFKIEVDDFFGNRCTLRGVFFVGKKRQLFAKIESDENNIFYITDVFNEDGGFVQNTNIFLSNKNGHSWQQNITSSARTTKFAVRLNDSIQILKLTANDEYDHATFPFFSVLSRNLYPSPLPVEFRLEKDFYDDYIRLELTVNGLLKDAPRLFVQQTGNRSIEVELIHQEFNRYWGVYPLLPQKDGIVNIEVYARDLTSAEVSYWDQFTIRTVTPQKGGGISSKDKQCWLQFGSGAVYKNLFLRLSETSAFDTNRYEAVGSIYMIEPLDVPLKRSATVFLKYPENDAQPDKLGIYGLRKKGRWSFIGNDLDQKGNTLSASLSSLGQVRLIRDVESPEIRIKSPRKDAYITQRYPKIIATVNDRLSGIADERSIVLKLDGEKVIAEYDPEEKTVIYHVDEPLSDGEHTVWFWAVDKNGNASSVSHRFTIRKNNN